jgi:hypothetical protein
MNKLPFTYQDLLKWYQDRHYQPAEAYTQADKLWRCIAPMILAEMTDAEVERFSETLSAEHGIYNGQPDISERIFPRCLFTRLSQIAERKVFAEKHQGQGYRLADAAHMIVLHVRAAGDEWMWEVIKGHQIDTFGTAKTETAAWAKVEEQWQMSQHRLQLK